MTVASLNATLLARKGGARPAVPGAEPAAPAGSTSPPPSAQPAQAAGPTAPAPRLRPAAAEPAPGGARARLTLRLDPERHRRLRLAAAHLDRSLQALLTDALERYLAELPVHCPCCTRGCRPERSGGGR
jgi:hypothetical protein